MSRANQRLRSLLARLTVATLAVLVGCDGDGDGTGEGRRSTASIVPTTAAPARTGSTVRTDVAAFCDAELEAEAAFLSEDPVRIAEANDAAVAAAPLDVADAVGRLIGSLDEGGAAFDAAYGEVIDYMRQHCGFTEITVTGGDYRFDGMPSSVPAGPAIITLDNEGAELHQLLLARLHDDVTATAEQLAALTEQDLATMAQPVGAAFAFPGTQGHGTVDLTPGRYVAVCFIPVGTTPDVFQSGGPAGAPSSAPTHASEGMVLTFDVA